MSLTLNATQLRVLGVLVEKAFTTPEQYPLTVNALVNGCNQKSNRAPVTSLDERDVVNALQELMHKKLVNLADALQGSRANRYLHNLSSQLPWSPGEQAVLTELMLRGPQTVGELRTRASRMVRLDNLQEVQNLLDALASNDPPEVVVLPREPGKSAVRFRHNFYTEDEMPEFGASPSYVIVGTTGHSAGSRANAGADGEGLEVRISALEARVSLLESKLTNLEHREVQPQ